MMIGTMIKIYFADRKNLSNKFAVSLMTAQQKK
jgi:hypothetical protein